MRNAAGPSGRRRSPWLRRYPRGPSEEGLATLGSRMACARQLDMLMQDAAAVRHFVERFLQGDYAAFA